jgi:Fic family protein
MTDFDLRISRLPASLWVEIAAIDELKGRWAAGQALHPYQLAQLKKSVLITSAGASTRIEGASLGDAEIERLIRGARTKRLGSRDEQEVRGYFELLQKVFEMPETIPFSESTVLAFHKELLKYVEKDEGHRGEYKTVENAVSAVGEGGLETVILKTTPPYLVRKEMETLLEWTGERLAARDAHPLAVIGNFVAEFLKIHPFRDGNGRLSRILTDLQLLKAGYTFVPYVSHERIVERRKVGYYVALRRSQATFGTAAEDLAPWLSFFTAAVREQAEKAVALMGSTRVEEVLTGKQLAVLDAVLGGKGVSAGAIAKKTGVARPTVNQALEKLLRLKKVSKVGMGRGTAYWPTMR